MTARRNSPFAIFTKQRYLVGNLVQWTASGIILLSSTPRDKFINWRRERWSQEYQSLEGLPVPFPRSGWSLIALPEHYTRTDDTPWAINSSNVSLISSTCFTQSILYNLEVLKFYHLPDFHQTLLLFARKVGELIVYVTTGHVLLSYTIKCWEYIF